MKDKLYSFIQHTLTFAGGFLVSKGYINEQELMELVGALMTMIGIIWGFYSKINNKVEPDQEDK